MSFQLLLSCIQEKNISVSVNNGKLAVRAPQGVMTPEIMALLKEHKDELLASLSASPEAAQPPLKITPAMLPLVDLTQEEIDLIVSSVPHGAANIQDIYPLSPLQEGILFHYMLEGEGDAYLLRMAITFDGRARLDRFLGALQQVIDRHDVLRSAIRWSGLSQPVQVVCRQAKLPVEQHRFADGDAMRQLLEKTDPRHLRLDLQCAPLLAAHVAPDPDSDAWFLSLLNHHIVSDHVTLELIIAEIQSILLGQGANLPPSVPYRNFIAQTRSVSPAGHEAYFRHQLATVDEPTAPFGLLDVQGDGEHIKEALLTLDEALAWRIRDSARRHGVTPAVLFHAAWALVLARCCGREDVVFGSVVSGRLQGSEAAGSVLGMFVNTLPVRISLAGLSVKEAVRDTYQRFSELLLHEQASLAMAQRCSGVSAPLPLFTALFNFRHSHVDVSEAGTQAAARAFEGIKMLAGEERTNYPITVSVDDLGQGFSLTAQCDGVDPARMTAFLNTAVEGLVDALAHNPQQLMASLGILGAEERRRLLVDFNATAADYPRGQLIQQLFEAQAASRPDAPALACAGASLTYGQLNRRANQLAHRLLALGLRPDERVAVGLERGNDMVLAMLAILKAGGAYVPLDPSHPVERLGFMLKDCAPVALLTNVALRESMLAALRLHVSPTPSASAESSESADLSAPSKSPASSESSVSSGLSVSSESSASSLPLLVLDEQADMAILAAQPESNPDPQALNLNSRHLAYVIYTSGSTGLPKGVMVEHRSVLRLVINNPYARISAQDCLVHCANPAFDAATWEIWGGLLNGARLLVVPKEMLLDPAAFALLCETEAVTILHLTVGLFNQYADIFAPVFPQLEYLLFGGEQSDIHVVARVLRQSPPKRLVHCYGPTETTTFATTHAVLEANESMRSLPIGRPIANTQVYILDSHGEPTPIGVSGEIVVGGDGVARGYLNLPELTAERFVRDPFATLDGQGANPDAAPDAAADATSAAAVTADMPRLYKTGDLGRWLADGTIEYLGRNDFQVKIRGFRIELGEIETKLAACPGVKEVVVIARDDGGAGGASGIGGTGDGNRRLVAYLIAQEGAELVPSDLRAQLASSLAEYMVPSAFVVLDAYPLTPNGKLDRRALPAPDMEAQQSQEYQAPQGPTETALAGIWQELLGVERVGRRGHFFELGGHSLMAVQLVSRIRATLGGEIALRSLFNHPTLQALANALQGSTHADHGTIAPADRSQPLPLSLAQQRLWFLDQLDGQGSASYHMPAGLRLSGKLDQAALQAALDRIVARHENLRTTFQNVDGQAVQVIGAPETGFALAPQDLRDAGAGQADALRQVCAEEFSRPFDLRRGPLVRGRLVCLGEQEHVLLVTQHHIISDGWSTGILVREFSALYSAFTQGKPDPLPPLAVQYADFAVWQRQRLQGEVLQAQTDYWKERLAGAPALLELPSDHPRPAQQSYAGKMVEFTLPPQLAKDLRATSQAHGVTLFMTMLAAWALLLSRLSGQCDVVIGTPVANRPRAEVEGLLGFFINTLVLRVRLEPDPTFGELLEQVKATTLGAYEHQDLPFEHLVEAINPPRSMSHSPLFQVMLSMDNTPGGTLELPGLTLSEIGREHDTTHFDLTLALTDSGGTLEGGLVYSSDLFERASIERFAAHFQTLLAAIVEDCANGDAALRGRTHVSQLPLLSQTERRCLLADFNATATQYTSPEPERLIHQLFERQAQAQPDAPALVAEVDGETGRLTYAELNRRANRVAHWLAQAGVGPTNLVAICVERSLDMVAGLLGILKAGCAYVPMDPANPPERLAYMLADCAPAALLTQRAVLPGLPALALPTLVLDAADGMAALARQADSNPDPATLGIGASDLAYVIYTSGSTGSAKGVMVEHHSAINFWHVLQDCYRHFPQRATVALNAAFSFDMSLKGILQLLSGHCLVLIPQLVRADGAALLEFLRRHRIDGFDCTPSQLEVLLAAGLNQHPTYHPNTVLIGGEAISAATWEKLAAAQHINYINMYGPTECTVDATIGFVRDLGPRSNIGKPIANCQIYLLDRALQPVPLGVAGEVYIGGEGVARGYLKRADMSAERFLADPFGTRAGARIYKTGDLGRWQANGTVEYLGRNDFQVKIRGFRIELGEIEAKLLDCDGVREALVLASEDSGQPGGKRLVAYLTAAAGAAPNVADLRTQLSGGLADYMIPGAFVVLEAFPLNANGKVDRRALPAPDMASVAVRDYVAPQSGLETVLAQIWQDLLGLERVGRHDHFFELGGHSLLAVQLVSRIRQVLGLEPALRDLFAEPTLAGLAGLLEGAAGSTMAAILPADRSQPLPLSWAQQRLWFLDQLDHAAGAAYHMPIGLRIKGGLDQAALQAALDRIVARHEVLRTTFVSIDSQPTQKIGPENSGFPLRTADLSGLPGLPGASLHSGADGADGAMLQLLAEEIGQPFDLGAGPLIRGQLFRVADGEHILLVNQHHIISDGWSAQVFARELCTLYSAFAQKQPDPLPPLPLQYADYAVWQRQWLQGEVLRGQTDYWKSHLGGAPALLELPLDHPRPAVQSFAGGIVAITLPADLTCALRAFCQRHGTTLFMALLAAWSVLLARLSGQPDVVVGMPTANRQRSEIESLIGFFINTLALRIRLEGNPGVADLLAQVKASTLGAYSHQDLPFEQVVEAIKPPRSMGHSPIFQTMLTLNNFQKMQGLALRGLDVSQIELGHKTTHFDLSLTLLEVDDALVGDIEYASDLFDPSTAGRIAGHLQVLLAAMAGGHQDANDSRPVSRLPLLAPSERQQLLYGFNATQTARPEGQLIHQMFEAQAEAGPDAPALMHGDETLSYRQLNIRANKVAHGLAAIGVRPDDRVAFCVERGVDMVVGLMGILKAGCAYVPMDPNYPAERLAHMLDDSAPAALLTQSGQRMRLPPSDAPVLLMDGPALAGQDGGNPDPRALGLTNRNLAYIIYTSGSTGKPKGVMIEHANAVNLIHNHIQVCGLSKTDRVLQFASISFDASVEEIFPILSVGGLMVLRPAEIVAPDLAFVDLLRQRRISVAELPTSFWHQWAQEIKLKQKLPDPALRLVVVGGEKAEKRCLADWLAEPALSQCRWLNTYGPTETTVYATQIAYGAGSVLPRYEIPIGGPVANSQAYILDGERQPVPLGVAGEIYLGGAGVARGYLNRPDLTAERFSDNPFSAHAGPHGEARMYRTGDLGRWSPDGSIEYLGRNDFQVKIRGFRIELGEIEARLAACAGVRAAVVVARQDGMGADAHDRRLVAYLTAHEGATLAATDLRSQISASLAEYMVPSAFVTVDAFPLTPNGKLDLAALPAPDMASVASRGYEAPQGQGEQSVALIWQDLLGLARVGRHDQFFELGGHSLLAVRMISRLRAEQGVEVALRDLFASPTLAEFAKVAGAAQAASLPPIVPADRSQPLPLSWSQQRLWFLSQLDDAASAAYHIPVALRLKGSLDKVALQAALDRILVRHENLRTRFVSVDNQPVQDIAAPGIGFSLTTLGLDELDEPDGGPVPGHQSDTEAASAQELAIARFCSEQVSRPFDLEAGPLIRGHLLCLSEDEHILLAVQHHIVSDGWSIGILVREFSALYAAFCQGQPDPLPPLAIQFADYAVWQRTWLQGDVLQGQADYWKNHLQGAPALLELPTDRFRPAVQSYAGGRVAFSLPADTLAGLRELGRRHGCTLFMTLLAGWGTLLARLSGQDDVVVGVPVANRQRAEVESLIGFFINTLALRVQVGAPGHTGGELDLAGLLAQVKGSTLGGYSHQDLPFEQVVEAVKPSRNTGHNPLFQVILSLDNTPEQGALNLPGLELSGIGFKNDTTQFDLNFSVSESGGMLGGQITYSSALFDRSTVERMLGHFKTLLAGMAAGGGLHSGALPVRQLPLLDQAERRQLLEGFNATGVAYPQDSTVHRVFEQQAVAQPDATALVCGKETVSYADLNRRANRLAHQLLARGVRPNAHVALCLERSVEMVVAMLAVLKTGCGYVPLDPADPSGRLSFLLSDSAPVALVTVADVEDTLPALSGLLLVVLLDEDAAAISKRPDSNPDAAAPGGGTGALAQVNSRSLAYIIYTSGSTGTPKGVMVEHRSILRLVLNNTASHVTPRREDCVAHCANPAFDASTWEIWGALLNGARLVVVPREVLLDPETLNRELLERGVTAMWLTVGLFNQYVDPLQTAFGRMNALLIGGDALDPRTVARLLDSGHAPRHLVNGYGPTETTTFAATFLISQAEARLRSIPIGKPIANTTIYLLDLRGEPVPLGVAGEIHIGGPGVARGYLNQAELTAERFVHDPFADTGAQGAGLDAPRLYKTGDLGRWLPDGNVEYLGRNDFQVKIRGFRIELGEIESRLAACPGVKEAAVLVRGDGTEAGDKRLAAYLVAHDGVELSAAGLRAQLSASLADYMIPSAFVMLEAFPLTPNGKLDRRALPAPDDASVLVKEFEPPQGEVETAMAQIWQDLLGLERVGRQDHFFELGGHSLLAVQLIGRLREKFDLNVPLKNLFEAPVLWQFSDIATSMQLALYQEQDLEDVVSDLDSLSESELLALLSEGEFNE